MCVQNSFTQTNQPDDEAPEITIMLTVLDAVLAEIDGSTTAAACHPPSVVVAAAHRRLACLDGCQHYHLFPDYPAAVACLLVQQQQQHSVFGLRLVAVAAGVDVGVVDTQALELPPAVDDGGDVVVVVRYFRLPAGGDDSVVVGVACDAGLLPRQLERPQRLPLPTDGWGVAEYVARGECSRTLCQAWADPTLPQRPLLPPLQQHNDGTRCGIVAVVVAAVGVVVAVGGDDGGGVVAAVAGRISWLRDLERPSVRLQRPLLQPQTTVDCGDAGDGDAAAAGAGVGVAAADECGAG